MISVSAPGKIILAGEHAVVYGKPALVAAVDRRLMVKITKNKKPACRQAGQKTEIFSDYPPDQIKEAIKRAKENLINLRGGRVPSLLKSGGLKIRVESEVPVKVGMGSSAAVAVATTGALLALSRNIQNPDSRRHPEFSSGSNWILKQVQNDRKCVSSAIKGFSNRDKELINQIAYQVEKKIHTHPSGVDNTITVFGGFLWYQKGKPFKKIKLKNLPKFVLVNTGSAEETTGEMVRSVRSRFDPACRQAGVRGSRFRKVFNQIEDETRNLLAGLEDRKEGVIMEAIRGCEVNLEKLGVVGTFAKKVIAEVEKEGGAAKICGAGGIKDRSGVLLCYHQAPEQIFSLADKFNLEAFEVKLGEKGLRIEN